jgi:hypothetical protein
MELISQEPVPELWVLSMQLPKHTDQLRISDLTLRAWLLHSSAFRLLTEAEHPARHRDRHPHTGTGRSHLAAERANYFWGVI